MYPLKTKILIAFIAYFFTQTTQAAGFVNGFILGTLLSSSGATTTHETILKNEDSVETTLFKELEHNNKILKDANSKQQSILKKRNQQIIIILTQSSYKSYVNQFSLSLIPIKENIIESETIKENDILSPIARSMFSGNKNLEAQTISRKSIYYQIKFTDNSPEPINDFNVISINNHLPKIQANKYFFTYSEHWGNNTIIATLQNKKNPSIKFNLRYSYDIRSPQTQIEDMSNDENYETMYRLFRFAPALLMASFLLRFLILQFKR